MSIADSEQPKKPTGWSKKRTTTFSPEAVQALAKLLESSGALGTNTPEFMARIADLSETTKRIQDGLAAQIAPAIAALARLQLSAPSAFRDVESNTAYSPEMTSPADYFGETEFTIRSFDGLHEAIRDLIAKNPNLPLLWRGQRNANWGMHSLLFRQLMELKKVRGPEKRHRDIEPYPTEDDMAHAEKMILENARYKWRMDGNNPLEIFARLQHFGAPTRLLDVTRNPYIGAWFAVEANGDSDESDGRLFALATHPVVGAEGLDDAETSTRLSLHDAGDSSYPFWHYLDGTASRQQIEWGTGALRRFWIPPAYEQRILAQDAGFILDGVPMTSSSTAPYFKKPGESSKYWRKADLLAASSIYTRLYNPRYKVPSNKRRFAPTFTFRITVNGKREIRKVLEERFSYSHATLYPDTEGLAQYLKNQLKTLLASE